MRLNDMTLEYFQRALQKIIDERLSHNPCSQEYVDRVVAKSLLELTNGKGCERS